MLFLLLRNSHTPAAHYFLLVSHISNERVRATSPHPHPLDGCGLPPRGGGGGVRARWPLFLLNNRPHQRSRGSIAPKQAAGMFKRARLRRQGYRKVRTRCGAAGSTRSKTEAARSGRLSEAKVEACTRAHVWLGCRRSPFSFTEDKQRAAGSEAWSCSITRTGGGGHLGQMIVTWLEGTREELLLRRGGE